MRQRKRRERTEGIGLYSCWERGKPSGCIYCGSTADTREHVPSKVFLLEPYPDNLPTVPACKECNNNFSKDEEYVACCVEVLRSIVNNQTVNEKVRTILNEKPHLCELVCSQITDNGSEIELSFDRKRIERILEKMAVCLAGFEFDQLSFSDIQETWFDFATNITEVFKGKFISPHYSKVFPEISSRFSSDYCTFFISNHDDAVVLMDWIEVQENQFRYQVTVEDDCVSVKMVISEFLFARVLL